MRLLARRHELAGVLILAGLVLQILSVLLGIPLTALASYGLWAAVILVWPDIPARTRWQSGVLAALGGGLLVAAQMVYSAPVDWVNSLSGNVYVLAMLIGVSFVGLIAGARISGPTKADPPTGLRAMANTWLGVHVLSIVLNLSTVFMVGDRLAREGRLQLPQLLVLNRSLSSAALWSPFFASMGVVLTLAPDMQYSRILMIGLPLAILAGAVALVDLNRQFDLSDVPGFSLAPRSVLMPLVMAALVMLFYHWLTPHLGIVSIITFVMPLAAVLTLLTSGLRHTGRQISQHTRLRLPLMRGEMSLFLAAGLLTLGLSTFIEAAAGSEWTLFARFGVWQAMISLVVVSLSALVGLHPIIGISVLASMLDMDTEEQTLFAVMALGTWAVGTSVGPLSGINLSLQGRYSTSGFVIMRHNLLYASILLILILAAMVLWHLISTSQAW